MFGDLNQVLPFYKEARIERIYDGSFRLDELHIVEVGDIGVIGGGMGHIQVYFVKPLNIYMAKVGFGLDIGPDPIPAEIWEIDYSRIADRIEITSDQRKALYPYSNGVMTCDLSPLYKDKLITAAANGVAWKDITWDFPTEPVYAPGSERASTNESRRLALSRIVESRLDTKAVKRMNEDLARALAYGKKNSRVDVTAATSAVEERIRIYFETGHKSEKVLCLIGNTAVAKSSLVKSLADEYGYRMVDLRVAFMSRLDINGLSDKVEEGDRVESYDCPQADIVECSDAYVGFAKEAVIKVQAAIDAEKAQPTPDADKLSAYEKALENFKEKSKTPVLFFDEITRSDKNVRNAIMTLLSGKTLMDMEFKLCRIISATNYPVGINDEELKAIFHTDDVEDVAFLNRLEPLIVTHESAIPGWLRWAASTNSKLNRQNIHKDLLIFLTTFKDTWIYNQSEPLDKYKESRRISDVSTTPFPNFRTWQFVSDYLYKQDSTKSVSMGIIAGLVGKDPIAQLRPTLEGMGWTFRVSDESTEMDDMVNECLNQNVPLLMVTPSAMGKTARVKKVAKRMLNAQGQLVKAELIEINLAHKDRTELMGFPVKVDLLKHMSRNFSDDGLGSLGTELSGLLKHFDQLPRKVTTKAPKTSVSERLRLAVAEGRPAILFFDELNRVSNPILMSAVFEAVSDHRFAGVNFDPNLVRIVAACNLGEKTPDAMDLDPAIAARFSIYNHPEYTLGDAQAFVDWVNDKANGFSPVLAEYLKSLPLETVKEHIASVEESTLIDAKASRRSLNDMSEFMKASENNKIITGAALFSENSMTVKLTDITSDTSYRKATVAAKFVPLVKALGVRLDNWVCLGDKKLKTTSGDTPAMIAEDIKALYNGIVGNDPMIAGMQDNDFCMAVKKLLGDAFSLERELLKKREAIFTPIVGEKFTKQFLSYYNPVAGIKQNLLKLEDLKSKANIGPYVDQLVSRNTDENAKVMNLVKFVKEFYDMYKDTLPPDFNQEVLDSCVGQFPNLPELRKKFMQGVWGSTEGKDFFRRVSIPGYEQWIVNILASCGISARIDDVKARVAPAQQAQAAAPAARKPRFL